MVWTVQRPQVYRALNRLEALGFAEVAQHEVGEGGPPRLLYRLSVAGHEALERWLFTPVEHLREGRSELLLKVVFLERGGHDPAPLLVAQRQLFAEILTRYRARLSSATGAEATALAWRTEMASAALAFLDHQLGRRRASA